MEKNNVILQENCKKDKVKTILFVVMIVSFLCALFSTIFCVSLYEHTFSDFAETLSYCMMQNPYNGVDGARSIYPPIAFLPFYLFALICKPELAQYLENIKNLSPSESYYPYMVELSQTTNFRIAFILFYLIVTALILLVVAKMSKFKGTKLVYLLISVFCFSPFVYAFCRGNNIILVGLLVLLFFWLYNSEKRWQRELANVCLAAAAAIKIYPLLIALFFIKDRRWMDLLKTICYALALIFLPFLLIKGGFGNIREIWNNFTTFNSGSGRNESWGNIGFDLFASKIGLSLFGSKTLYSLLSKFLRYGAIIVTLVAIVLSKNTKHKFQPALMVILTYELWMGVSYYYTMCALIYPVIMYIICFNDLSKFDKWFYGICFAFIAIPVPFWFIFENFFVCQLAGIALLIKTYIDLFTDFQARKKHKPLEKVETKEIERQEK
ncbi:MAG: DUF2029 domain-containing protein [Clostridia bacterium]|nr:DUF2029 domain-containing protein [Clostridia bacterium]